MSFLSTWMTVFKPREKAHPETVLILPASDRPMEIGKLPKVSPWRSGLEYLWQKKLKFRKPKFGQFEISPKRRTFLAGMLAASFVLSGMPDAAAFVMRAGKPTASGNSVFIKTLTLPKTSTATQLYGWNTTMWGVSFPDLLVIPGTAPKCTLADGVTIVPYSIGTKPIYYPSGCMRWVPMMWVVPATVAGSGSGGSIQIKIYTGGTFPAASNRSRADYTTTNLGKTLNVTAVGLGGDTPLTGTWVSDLTTGIATNNSYNCLYMDGAAGRVDRICQSFQSGSPGGVNHGYLECWWYVQALQNLSGGLAGVRYLPRITMPWTDVNLGPGGADKEWAAFSSLVINDGSTLLHDLGAAVSYPQAFTMPGTNSVTNVSWSGLPYGCGTLVRVSGASLPGNLVAGTSYFLNTQALSTTVNFSTRSNAASGGAISAGTSGSGTMIGYPYVVPYGSIMGATSNAGFQYIQGNGSQVSDTTCCIQNNTVYDYADARLLPQYDPALVNQSTCAQPSYRVMITDPVETGSNDTGDRPDLGVISEWNVAHLYNQSIADEINCRTVGLIGCQWPVNLRIKANNATIITCNNGSDGNGASYPGMAAPLRTACWIAAPKSSSSSGTGTKSFWPIQDTPVEAGFANLNTAHIVDYAYYVTLLTGEPQFMDQQAEWGNIGLLQYENFSLPSSNSYYDLATINSSTVVNAGKNLKVDTNFYYGATIFLTAGLRNAAWAHRYTVHGSVFNYPENASFQTYFADCVKASSDCAVHVINNINAVYSFSVAHGCLWFGNGYGTGQYITSWQTGYAMTVLMHDYQISQYANTKTAVQELIKFYGYYVDTFGQANATNSHTVVQSSANGNGAMLTSAASPGVPGALTGEGGNILGWTAGDPNILINGSAGANGNIGVKSGPAYGGQVFYQPTVGDVVLFFGAGIGASPPFGPFPSVFTTMVPYWVVSVTSAGYTQGNPLSTTWKVQFSATPSGSPITPTDSYSATFNGWLDSSNVLHVTAPYTGTIQYQAQALSSVGQACSVAAGAGYTKFNITAKLATAGGDYETYSYSGPAQTAGSSGSPLSFTSLIDVPPGFYFTSVNPPASASYNSNGPVNAGAQSTGYLTWLTQEFKYARQVGLTVSGTAIAACIAACNTQGVNLAWNPKSAWLNPP